MHVAFQYVVLLLEQVRLSITVEIIDSTAPNGLWSAVRKRGLFSFQSHSIQLMQLAPDGGTQ
jgi:hypothetical protein